MTQISNHDGVVTHLELDILKSEVNWALGSITTNKASRGDGIPADLFHILKDDAVKGLHSICQQIWKTQQWPQGLEKVSFHFNPKNGQCQRVDKLPPNRTTALISHASKVMLKILQAGFQQYVNQKLTDVQAEFRKGRGTRDQIAIVH